MLDTVLQIGKAFRESPDGLKHHRYVVPCPQDTDKQKILRLSIPVVFNGDKCVFDFDNVKEITDENIIRDKLFYLKYKTSDSDGLVKYVFGDIFYSTSIKKGLQEEGGYYRMADLDNKSKGYRVSSFYRGNEDCKEIENIFIKQYGNIKAKSMVSSFHISLEESIDYIERMLRYHGGIADFLQDKINSPITFSKFLFSEDNLIFYASKFVYKNFSGNKGSKKLFKQVLDNENPQWDQIEKDPISQLRLANFLSGDIFIHFDFNGKHWYEFDHEFISINTKLLEEFAEKDQATNQYMLKKYLYKTLSSPEKDLQFPYFSATGRYRNKCFNSFDDILSLIYAVDYSKKALISIPKTDIKIVVLPKGDGLKSIDYENFFTKASENEVETLEENVNAKNSSVEFDELFSPLLENTIEHIVKFDMIFSKKGGQTTPDIDMIELSGLQKSHLRFIREKIRSVKVELEEKRSRELKAESTPFSVTKAFYRILNDGTDAVKKYQSHLFKTLPLIYSDTYYHDQLLLPALISVIEKSIRSAEENQAFWTYHRLKYDFIFLTFIQNSKVKGGNFMKIVESQSYKLGVLLGKLAQNFAGHETPIKSFEKSYVGNLTRRIASISDLLKFKTFIEEKLVMHEKNFENVRTTSLELTEKIKNRTEKYNKNECAFGFFESYFAPFSGKQNQITDSLTDSNN
ncbi:MAG: hypothetical protein PHW04_12700 [Candidatus Wallbacteria bacterium]|nr:hypothetical protein [Candidatus Wallbacteria bacterium]